MKGRNVWMKHEFQHIESQAYPLRGPGNNQAKPRMSRLSIKSKLSPLPFWCSCRTDSEWGTHSHFILSLFANLTLVKLSSCRWGTWELQVNLCILSVNEAHYGQMQVKLTSWSLQAEVNKFSIMALKGWSQNWTSLRILSVWKWRWGGDGDEVLILESNPWLSMYCAKQNLTN